MRKNWENPVILNLKLEETKQPGRYYKCVNCGAFHKEDDLYKVDFEATYCKCRHGYYIFWTGEDPVTQS